MKHFKDYILEELHDVIVEAVDYSTRDLTYNGQLQFERAFIKFANKTFGKDALKRKKVNISIYFDGDDCVDPNNDETIPGVVCDGKMTWTEAIDKLIEHFRTTYNL